MRYQGRRFALYLSIWFFPQKIHGKIFISKWCALMQGVGGRSADILTE